MPEIQLPNKLDLDGELNVKELFAALFQVFRKDFIDRKPYFKALPVVFDDRKLDSPYPEGFWHVITRGKGERVIDFKRAKRLPWLKPLILQAGHPDLYTWYEEALDNKVGHSVKTWFIWYEPGAYLVVLKERPNKFFLATAFYVTGVRNHDYYYDKYQLSLKKKGTGL